MTTGAGARSAAGEYALVAGGGASDKYRFVYGSGILTVTRVPVTIVLENLIQSYTGQGLTPNAKSSVADVALTLTYNGSAVRPVLPGSYTVVASPSEANYTGGATGTLVIERAEQYVTIQPLALKVPLKCASGPVAVVMGDEETGLSNDTWKLCDAHVKIPLSAKGVGSLNVSVAAGVITYEVVRQRAK